MPRPNASLRSIFSKHTGNVSDKWSIYLGEYERLFEPYRNRPIHLLEIGIQNGGSLEIWAEYFRNAQKLVGCDIDTACEEIQFKTPKIEIVVGDANAPESVNRIRSIADQYDLVIDDGSHKSDDIVKSFSHYFDMVRDGGMYVAEDLHCSYWGEYGGGIYYPYSSLTFFKMLADTINQEHWGIDRPRSSVLDGFKSRYGVDFSERALSRVHSVEFVNSMCIVRKAPADQNSIGERCITGSTASVVPAVLGLSKDRFSLDQSSNPWTARTVSIEEELASANADVGRFRSAGEALTAEVERLRHLEHDLAASASEVARLRHVDEEVKTRGAEIERLLGVQAGLHVRIANMEADYAIREKESGDQLIEARGQVREGLVALDALRHEHALECSKLVLERERHETELTTAHVERERVLFAQVEELRLRNEALLLEALEVAKAHARQLDDVQEIGRGRAEDAARHHREETTALQEQVRIRQGELDDHLRSRVLREEEFAAQLQQLHGAMAEREERQVQAHAQREQRLLTNLSESNARSDAYVLQMAEIQKSFLARLEIVEREHRSELQARLHERTQLVENFETIIRRKDRELAERDEVTGSYRALTAELQGELQSVYGSLSWRLGSPWRRVRAVLAGKS